jgi:hypothetical protein
MIVLGGNPRSACFLLSFSESEGCGDGTLRSNAERDENVGVEVDICTVERLLDRRIKTLSTSASSSSSSVDLIGSARPSRVTMRSWLGHGVLSRRRILAAVELCSVRLESCGGAIWMRSADAGESGCLRMDASSWLNDEGEGSRRIEPDDVGDMRSSRTPKLLGTCAAGLARCG